VDAPHRPLHEAWPVLRGRLPWIRLGVFPTPVEALDEDTWVKRDDLSSPVYGGNKVRTLEVLFGDALERGATHVYATGAFGTNHGVATLLHAPRVGLVPKLLLFPQPASASALENFEVLRGDPLEVLPHWSALPAGIARVSLRHRLRGERAAVMVPGGATPLGALGYASAAFELALQIEEGALPPPETIVLPVGSTCTTAGLLLGTALAAARGVGFQRAPRIHAVRVTPWPVTDPFRISVLARRASELLHALTGDERALVARKALRTKLTVDGSQIGRGYGHPTDAGRAAMTRLPIRLDTTYSAKAAAAMLALPPGGPRLFWATKSSAPLPTSQAQTPRWLRWWARRAAARS